jgi:hypothetical protein
MDKSQTVEILFSTLDDPVVQGIRDVLLAEDIPFEENERALERYAAAEVGNVQFAILVSLGVAQMLTTLIAPFGPQLVEYVNSGRWFSSSFSGVRRRITNESQVKEFLTSLEEAAKRTPHPSPMPPPSSG